MAKFVDFNTLTVRSMTKIDGLGSERVLEVRCGAREGRRPRAPPFGIRSLEPIRSRSTNGGRR
ncbi:MAG: hypothetical protein HOV81_45395 [Kofleriaceae bacterium]|nr:hypothetical protein [Kofleriaceae bacterium]